MQKNVLFLSIVTGLTACSSGHMNGHGMFHSGGWGMWLVWIGLLLAVAAAVFYLRGGTSFKGREDDPLTILKKRYARGEISKEEFERLKKDIE